MDGNRGRISLKHYFNIVSNYSIRFHTVTPCYRSGPLKVHRLHVRNVIDTHYTRRVLRPIFHFVHTYLLVIHLCIDIVARLVVVVVARRLSRARWRTHARRLHVCARDVCVFE